MKLNERQQALLNALDNHAKLGISLTRRDIQNTIPEWYPITDQITNNDASAKLITKDIRDINTNSQYGILIMSSPKLGIKLASQEEIKSFLDREKAAIVRRFKRYWLKVRKANNNGALMMSENDFNSLKEIESLLSK
jgi:hypothetical protein